VIHTRTPVSARPTTQAPNSFICAPAPPRALSGIICLVTKKKAIRLSTPAIARPLYRAGMTFFMPGDALTKKQPMMDATIDTAAQRQRVQHRVDGRCGHQQGAQHHGGDQRHGIGLKQVGGHAGAVAHVVAHVVGDHGRVARVILGDAGFHLAHQVGAHVGALGEDAAAQARKDGDQGRAEGKADQRVQQRGEGLAVGRDAAGREEPVKAGHAQQAQAHHQHAGDGAAAEGHVQRRANALGGGLRGAHIGPHRDTFMPMKPQAPDSTAPITKPMAVLPSRNKPISTASTTPTMAMVLYCRAR
jgi:hypothetical protein